MMEGKKSFRGAGNRSPTCSAAALRIMMSTTSIDALPLATAAVAHMPTTPQAIVIRLVRAERWW